ncbi:hypothetical protein H0H93_010812 [Arthromyces matolae]|nr:hypothetical protein H0H93_010812 [Arthromyces matolae]
MLDSFLARWIRPQPEPIVHDQSQDIGITITRTTTTTDDTGLPCSIQRPARSEKSPFSSIVRTKSKLKAKWKGENIKIGAGSDGGLSISHPIAYPSPLSLTGFGPDTPGSLASGSERWYPQPPYAVSSSQSSPTRYGPSNVEWKISAEEEQLEDIDMDSRRRQAILIPTPPPPAVVRVPGSQSEISRADHTSHFIGRSASAPLLSMPMEEPTQSYPDTSLAPSSKGTLKVNIASYHQDTASAITPSVSTDVYNNAYNYPLAKQLSPIIEQDYSPVSLRTPTRGHGSQGSQGSITLSTSSMGAAKFSSSHPFLTRPLNRTISQTSSHTQGSSSSSVPRVSPFTSGSSFPTLGLHTSDHTSLPPDPPLAGSPLKIEHSYDASMPRISGSSESGLRNEYVNKDGDEASEVWGGEGDYTRESLHAESFVTASDVHGADEMGFWTQQGEGTKELEMEVAEAHLDGASTTSLHPQTNLSAIALNAETVNQNDNFQGNTSANTSTSSSYVPIHSDRDAALGTGVVGVTFKPPHTWLADRFSIVFMESNYEK